MNQAHLGDVPLKNKRNEPIIFVQAYQALRLVICLAPQLNSDRGRNNSRMNRQNSEEHCCQVA
jgi:hypothetical protein